MARSLPRLAFALLLAAAAALSPAYGRTTGSGRAALGEIASAELPAEARRTLILIRKGGPFPYPRDGVAFGNYERRLPVQPRGYYREYTVPTPGARDRGARRIVAGAGPQGDVRSSDEYYYSADHYRSFSRIRN